MFKVDMSGMLMTGMKAKMDGKEVVVKKKPHVLVSRDPFCTSIFCAIRPSAA